MIVLVVLVMTGTGQLLYLLAPGFLAVLTVPFGIAWIARPSRLPKADPVLDRTGIRLSADGRLLRRDVVLPYCPARGPQARRRWRLPSPRWVPHCPRTCGHCTCRPAPATWCCRRTRTCSTA
ncbi:hypothetical protein FHR83_004029 [Actinoplanes campanulatus]|uniref:Uncharacterized protein n=1 Tax=Actinoplanes campanulatus TaxID=113559 RepID=A0A7W5AIG1_9ACTN|nr:hypothetical protein [Actinoplanes campanulatus]MBB3096359.1 hypothetical protein [Actinoplanes campanulatus]